MCSIRGMLSYLPDDSNRDFLRVRSGDFVLVEGSTKSLGGSDSKWWIAQVLNVVGGARNPSANSLFQVINIDTGNIKYINADLVTRILQNGYK